MNINQQWEEDLYSLLSERWEQLKGYYDNPFLEKPIALPDTCPKCGVNIKLFYKDCVDFIRETREQVKQEVIADMINQIQIRDKEIEQAKKEERERAYKIVDTYLVTDWSGEDEVYEQLEEIGQRILSDYKPLT